MYHYQGGKYVWGKGHWMAPHPGHTLVQARWVEEGGKWVRHPSRWVSPAGAAAHPVEAHPVPGHPAEKR